jgi:azurin
VVETKDAVGLSFAIPIDGADAVSPAVALDAASRLNQAGDPSKPVHVEVTAPSFQLAKSIADDVVAALRPHLLGDPARIVAATNVDAGGGEHASVTIRTAR